MSGRQTKLNSEVQTMICSAIEQCCTDKVACESVGISHTTFYKWINRGQAELDRVENTTDKRVKVRKAEALYVEFVESVNRARAIAFENASQAIHQAVMGIETKETYTSIEHIPSILKDGQQKKDADGNPIFLLKTKTNEKIIQNAPDWRAAAFYLERRDPQNWSAKIDVNMKFEFDDDLVKALDLLGVDASAAFEQFRQMIMAKANEVNAQ